MKLDLNSDLGEGEPLARTRALMRRITSANIACGGHAGGLQSMTACVRLAKRHGVRIGAHPGPWNRAGKGRETVSIAPSALELLLIQQVSAFEHIVRSEGAHLRHIKLHGGLYHATERSAALARTYVACVGRWWPRLGIIACSRGRVAHAARRAGVDVAEEIFADRNYRDDGSLVPRGEPDALITSPKTAAARIEEFLTTSCVRTVTGRSVRLRADTICVHADTPRAVAIAAALARCVAG